LKEKAPDCFSDTDLVVPFLSTSRIAYPLAPGIDPESVYELGAAMAGAECAAARSITQKIIRDSERSVITPPFIAL